MSPLRLAFALGDAPIAAPAGALTMQTWIGGPMGGGPNAVARGPEQRLLLCDLPAGATEVIEGAADTWTWFGEQILPGAATSPAESGGLLMNVMTIDAANEEEFNEWYDAEHMPRLSDVDGALACRRFKAIDGTPRYAAIYHLRDRAVCQGRAWMAAASTPWTTRMRRLASGNRRLTFSRME
jgi:hypothetical protein